MRFKFLGIQVESESPHGDAAREWDEQGARSKKFLAEVPQLRPKRFIFWAGVSNLIEDGWTPDELRTLLDSWPDVHRTIDFTAIADLGGGIRAKGIRAIPDVVAWTHILLESADGHVQPSARMLEGRRGIRGLLQTVDAFIDATGSQHAALQAAQEGLTSTEAAHRH